jgi:hypothetical protein
MVAMGTLNAPAARGTPPAVEVMVTIFPAPAQLNTPGSFATQPVPPTGTNVSPTGNVTVIVPVQTADTGTPGRGVVELVLVSVTVVSSDCPANKPVAHEPPASGKIGIEPLA